MRKIYALSLFLVFLLSVQAETSLQEKRLDGMVEKFIVNNRKSDGDYTTISLRGWRNEMNMPAIGIEDMIRKILSGFETHYKNLKIINYTIGYTNKSGGGLEYDFILIHHETKPARTLRFATKD